MNGYVKSGTISSRTQMIALLHACFEEGGYYVALRADASRFDFFKPELAGWLTANWTEGRVFSKRMEVRWCKAGNESYETLVLAEEDTDLERFGLEAMGEDWSAHERPAPRGGIYLWGRYRESRESWIETRIPHPLRYPVREDVSENRFVRISHVDYCASNGAVQFVRLKEVL